jgi:branched-chain amino acid transport system permease protein
MVTLAFAQAGSVLALKNPFNWTGGADGFGLDYTKLPYGLIGSSPGHVWQAIRENELRVQVLGLRSFDYKLMVFVLSSFLATAGGVVYVLLVNGASPEVTSASFTLSLLVMVVIGGTGTKWGALIGGALYTYADHRLGDLAGSHAVSQLPSVLRTPLQEPLFILGVLFILVVFFVPGGLVRVRAGGRPRALRRLGDALQTRQETAA